MRMLDVATMSEDQAIAIRAALSARPDAMIQELARSHGVSEFAVLTLLGPPRVCPLDHGCWEALIRELPALGDVRVLVSNSGATMESRGTFGGFSLTGPYFNVQTRSLDLHIRWERIAGILAVEKPSHQTGHPTASIQCFDPDGAPILKIFVLFGARATESAPARAAFDAMRERYRIASAIALEA